MGYVFLRGYQGGGVIGVRNSWWGQSWLSGVGGG